MGSVSCSAISTVLHFICIYDMDSAEFQLRGREMIDYIVNYLENVGDRRVTPDVTPGYLRPLLPATAPENPEPWEDMMHDVEEKILTGMTHWQHPRFHAYFSSGNSYPSFLASGVVSRGGGVIQSSASECILDALLAARALAIKRLRLVYGDHVEDGVLLSKLVAYCSK